MMKNIQQGPMHKLPGSSWMSFSRACLAKLGDLEKVREGGGLSAPGVAAALEKSRLAAAAAAQGN